MELKITDPKKFEYCHGPYVSYSQVVIHLKKIRKMDLDRKRENEAFEATPYTKYPINFT